MKTLEDFLALDNDIRNKKREFENEYFKSEIYQKLENDESVIFNELVELITKELDAQNLEDACYSHDKKFIQSNEISGVDYCIESDYFTILGKPINKELLENVLISNALEQYCYDSHIHFSNNEKEYPYFSVSTAHEAFLTFENEYYNAELSRDDRNNWTKLNRNWPEYHAILLHEKVCNKSGVYNGLYKSDYYGSPSEMNIKVNRKFRDNIENCEMFLDLIELEVDTWEFMDLDEFLFMGLLKMPFDEYELINFELLEMDLENASAKIEIIYSACNNDIFEQKLTKVIQL